MRPTRTWFCIPSMWNPYEMCMTEPIIDLL